MYVKEPAPNREDRLQELLAHVQGDDTAAYKRYQPTDDLEQLITDDLAILLSERFLQDTVVSEPGSTTWGVHLPEPPSAIVGRDGELAALGGWVADPYVRLITLVGPGGIGKTRLGLELARSTAMSYADGAVMVALQDVRTDDEVAPAIAAAMGITFDRATVNEALAGSIGSRRVLLFLDNFEHVLGAARPAAPTARGLSEPDPAHHQPSTARAVRRARVPRRTARGADRGHARSRSRRRRSDGRCSSLRGTSS